MTLGSLKNKPKMFFIDVSLQHAQLATPPI